MHAVKICPHCGEPVQVDMDYLIHYHEDCGNDFEVDYAEDATEEQDIFDKMYEKVR